VVGAVQVAHAQQEARDKIKEETKKADKAAANPGTPLPLSFPDVSLVRSMRMKIFSPVSTLFLGESSE